MSNRKTIIAAYAVPFICLVVFYFKLLGGQNIDASPDRDTLYWLTFIGFPVYVGAFIIHLLLSFCTPEQLHRTTKGAFVGGFAGPLAFFIAIANSSDPESMMGVILIPLVYCASVPVAGLLAMVAIKMSDRRRVRGAR